MISAVAATSRSRSGLGNRYSFQENENWNVLFHRCPEPVVRRELIAALYTQSRDRNRYTITTMHSGHIKASSPAIKVELVGRTQESKNWGGMIISILVIIFICSVIVVVALIVSENEGYYLINEYQFEDVFNESQQERQYHFQWINDSVYASKDAYNNIVLTNLRQGDSVILLENKTWNVEQVSDFSIDPTGEYILLVCRKEIFYRYSYTAVFKVYDIGLRRVLPPLRPADITEEYPRLRYASWSPDSRQQSLVFVYNNNIYYQEGVTGTPQAITTSGEENLIYHGVPDYALEGDLIDSSNAIYWFKRGGRLVYATFNDTGVEEAFVTKYDYLPTPMVESYPYPKPGGRLPQVTLNVVDLETSQTTELIPPAELSDQVHFYKYVVWVNRYRVSVTWLNRLQDYCIFSLCDTDTGVCNVSVEQEGQGGWVVNRGPPIFSEDGDSYALIWPLDDDDAKDRHYHVHVVTLQGDGRDEMRDWTSGSYEVTKIIAYRKLEQQVYFLANKNATWDSHLYRVTMGRKPTLECLSCDLRPTTCTYYDAEVVEDTSKYVLHCRGPGIPKTTLHDFDADPLTYQLLENNTALYESVYSKVHLEQESHWFKVNEMKIPVRIMYHNKKDENRHHPLLINIMDDAGSSMVRNEFYQGWFTYLASQYHIITANIDFRGTSGSGQKHLYANRNKFGTVEVDDIIGITEYLRNSSLGVVSFNKTQFDQTKVAIMGSAYGGFLASMAYAKSDFFNCSIALSPITDWRYYSAVGTERFMSLPTAEGNLQGYRNANVSDAIVKNQQRVFHHNDTLLIVHGMADKLVHFQHSANLVKTLANADIAHRTLFYPDEGHDLLNSKVKRNLYQSMTDFLVKCLKLDEEVES